MQHIHPESRFLQGVEIAAIVLVALLALFFLAPRPAQAHRSGCHAWHSCPSDHGTYICGDTGHCSACPNNRYCRNHRPRKGR